MARVSCNCMVPQQRQVVSWRPSTSPTISTAARPKLGEQEKQNIPALSQAVGGGGPGSDGLSGAALGANLAKNSVENNFFTTEQGSKFAETLSRLRW